MSGVEVVEGPFVTRRQELGAASARSLLLTVLGEFVLPCGRPVWTSALIELLGDLDVAEKAARQAIMRTADSGWIEASRIGRETRWSLTDAGTDLLREGTDRIYSFAADGAAWDGEWLVLTVGVPENNRPLRQQLRTQLGWAGLGSPTAGRLGDPPDRPRGAGPQGARGARPARRQLVVRRDGRARSATSARWPARPGTSTTSSGGTRTSWSWSAGAVRAPTGRRWSPRCGWCRNGAGSRCSTRACRGSCCRRAGPATARPRCSGSGTPPGRRAPSSRGRSSPARR